MPHSIQWSIQTHDSLSSTQDTLKDLIAKSEAKEGTLIHALEQTGGYGRHGRKWEGATGNLSFSFLLRPDATPIQSATLSLVTGIALTRVIRSMIDTDHEIILKWPNDVMINGEKCAGVLLENIDGNVVIGIGVNVKSAPIKESTYLDNHTNAELSLDSLLPQFLETFSKLYALWLMRGFSAFCSDFEDLSYKKDTLVCVKLPKNNVEGQFQGVNEDGSMLILCKETKKLQKITAGDVFLV